MASSIIPGQSGDYRYEDSGQKLNNKARLNIAAFGGRSNLHGLFKKGPVPAAAIFLRILKAISKELHTG
jgi:hypothetical protein